MGVLTRNGSVVVRDGQVVTVPDGSGAVGSGACPCCGKLGSGGACDGPCRCQNKLDGSPSDCKRSENSEADLSYGTLVTVPAGHSYGYAGGYFPNGGTIKTTVLAVGMKLVGCGGAGLGGIETVVASYSGSGSIHAEIEGLQHTDSDGNLTTATIILDSTQLIGATIWCPHGDTPEYPFGDPRLDKYIVTVLHGVDPAGVSYPFDPQGFTVSQCGGGSAEQAFTGGGYVNGGAPNLFGIVDFPYTENAGQFEVGVTILNGSFSIYGGSPDDPNCGSGFGSGSGSEGSGGGSESGSGSGSGSESGSGSGGRCTSGCDGPCSDDTLPTNNSDGFALFADLGGLRKCDGSALSGTGTAKLTRFGNCNNGQFDGGNEGTDNTPPSDVDFNIVWADGSGYTAIATDEVTNDTLWVGCCDTIDGIYTQVCEGYFGPGVPVCCASGVNCGLSILVTLA